ncbi:ribosome-inactivating protein charybdin-like [Neltuma alba]|uniref:ribosome-inactivating protein charybdin-like n=1 Tax=Neltuma alba TaxID=207710 RepID=UPI0010A59972|nr:ribosome-inactivating protein charybdin-like [Prosopis alba]
MVVEFTEELNVETSTRGDYRDFIQNLRRRLGVRSSHNRPALAVQRNPPTRFFDLVLRTNDHSVSFRFRMDNLYLLGYQMENGQWLEFDNRDRNNQPVHLITEPGTNFLGFDGSYGGLERAAHQTTEQMRVGVHSLDYAINQLAVTTSGEARARSLVVVIMMICESTRLIPVFNYVADSFDNRPRTTRDSEGQIQPWIMDLVRSWDPLSSALLRADAYPEERFQLGPNNIRIPPENREIRTMADAIAILGILLGLCFYPKGPKRLPRMASADDDDGQCFLGLPLLQVFSVQINNIDGEDPGQLYGTIILENGLYTQFIYNRTSDN